VSKVSLIAEARQCIRPPLSQSETALRCLGLALDHCLVIQVPRILPKHSSVAQSLSTSQSPIQVTLLIRQKLKLRDRSDA
jgi:hypothetical protein